MQRVNEYRFYELGKKIGGIAKIEDSTPYRDVWLELWEARMALDLLREDAVSFRICLPAIDEVINRINQMVPMDFKDAMEKLNKANIDPPATIGFAYYNLSEALKAFEPVLSAECTALDTYVISQKRGYSTPDLVDRSEVMLPKQTVELLDDTIIGDIRSAGRCLAFDAPTAAGFHVLRAIEAVMARSYLING
jgi:hypothetical protein